MRCTVRAVGELRQWAGGSRGASGRLGDGTSLCRLRPINLPWEVRADATRLRLL